MAFLEGGIALCSVSVSTDASIGAMASEFTDPLAFSTCAKPLQRGGGFVFSAVLISCGELIGI